MRRPVKIRRTRYTDVRFESPKVGKLINYVMYSGKKELARRIVYDAFALIKSKTKQEPLEVFETALKNAAPQLEVRTRRVGGANYQIPHEVSTARQLTLALRWLVSYSRARPGHTMSENLAEEIMAAAKNEGETIKKRETVHKMAEANRAFAYFARPMGQKPKPLTPKN